MKDIWAYIQSAFLAIGGFLGWYLGAIDGFIYALLAFVVVDYISGVLCAITKKQVSSAIGAKGLFRKVMIFALVGIGHLIDVQVLGESNTLRTAIIFFYLANEGLSILENSTCLGLPVPEKLKDVLAQLHNRAEKDGTDTDDSSKE